VTTRAAGGAPFNANDLIATARRLTGLGDLGGDDVMEPLQRFLDSLNDEGRLSTIGRSAMRRLILRLLEQRLRIAAALAQHPEIRDVPVKAPIFILGLTRTGTTLLHNLLAQDSAARVPLLWELLRPAPPPDPATRATDPRIGAARSELAMVYQSVPDLRRIHAQDATAPDECFHLLALTFQNFIADITAPCPSYLRWLLTRDVTGAYAYYRTALQVLTWKLGGQYLVLKAPSHLFALDALLAVFPDARIVQTHRDPRQVAASSCSLFETARTLYTEDAARPALGETWLENWGTAMDRAMAARDRARSAGFHDVDFAEIMADPIGVVAGIHARFGIETTPGTDQRMTAWLAENPRDKHGVHSYSLARYALDPDRVGERFAGYIARYCDADGARRGAASVRPAEAAGRPGADPGPSRPDVTRADRERLHGHRGVVVWLTGLSGAGKTAVAHRVEALLAERGHSTYVLDGDNVRSGLNRDLSFSSGDRAENARRLGEVGKLLADAGIIALTACISPYRSDRDRVRARVADGGFLEVYVAAPLATCEARDSKGLYRQARAGLLAEFTGISAPYEPPERPDLVLPTDQEDLETSARRVIGLLEERGYVSAPGVSIGPGRG
jgi:adenylyl-sulfate kinase